MHNNSFIATVGRFGRSKGRYGEGPEGDPGGPWGFSWGGPREGPGSLGGPGNF